MTLLLSNILPSDHNSDLPLPKCQLVYAILTQVSAHVAQLISNAIVSVWRIAPPKHPANHRGQVQLNDTLYRYNMHQQSQDPSPFPRPTPEQFGAIVVWPRDKADSETRAGPARATKNSDFIFIWCYCFQLLFCYLILIKLNFDVIAFSCYFVISFW